MWINEDGSGKVRIQYTLPGAFEKHLGDPDDYLKAITDIDAKEESVKITTLSYESTGGKSLFGGSSKRFLLEATFSDITEFSEVANRNEKEFIAQTGADPDQIDSLAGKISFEMNYLTPRIQRSISLQKLLPENIKKFPGMLGKSNFSYTFHLPFPLEETNAHFLSEDRKTARWKFKLKEHVQTPLVMKMETTIPLPWWLYAIGSIIAFLLVGFLFHLIRKNKKAASP